MEGHTDPAYDGAEKDAAVENAKKSHMEEQVNLEKALMWDTKMTRTEWTIYWKQKYENSILRIHEAKDHLNNQATVISKLKGQLHAMGLVLSKFPTEQVQKAKNDVRADLEASKNKGANNEDGQSIQ